MSGLAVEIVIDAPVSFVWSDVADIASHVDWMADATAIRFVSNETQGIGTRFECDTAVGPFRLTDVMEITDWQPERSMGVHHQGLVTGQGTFGLRASGSATIFSWVETLRFPWYLGGPLTATAAKPVLRSIWQRNLARLKARIEAAWLAERQAQL